MTVNEIALKETREARTYRLRWWILVTIAISVLVVILDATVMNVALPTIQKQLNASSSELLWMVNVYTMILGSVVITFGGLGDRWGRGKLLQSGLLVFGLSSLAAFLSTTPTLLIVSRVFMGAGAAMIMPSTLSILTAVFPENERGQAIGVWAGINAIGIALGPIIGGLLVEHYNWNSIFLINIPVAVVALVLGWFFIPDSKDLHPPKLDLVGNLLSLVGLAALIWGLINGSSRGWTDSAVLAALIGAVVVLTLFVFWERKTSHPLIKLSLFRNPGFSTGISILVIIGLAMNGIIYVLTYYMQFVQNYDPLGAGVRFVPFAVGMLLGAISSAKLVKLWNSRWIIALSYAGTGIVLGLMSLLKADTSFWILGTEFVFFGLLMGCAMAPVTNIIMSSLPKANTGLGSAINNSFRQIAGTIGVAISGAILGSFFTSHFLAFASAIQGLPAQIIQKASDSVGMAVGIARSGQLPAATANSLTQLAHDSFMHGWSAVMLISGGIMICGGILAFILIPGTAKNQGQDQ